MSLLHNVFLIMCVYVCSICNFGISWKMAGSDEHGLCSRVCFILGGACYGNRRNVACSFLRADSGQNTTFEWFYKFKSGMNCTENTSCSGQPSTNKKITVQIK